MPAYFDQGFMVRKPAWHGLGVVLDEYPGRDEAMRLAGHDFKVIERDVALVGEGCVADGPEISQIKGWKALVKQNARVECESCRGTGKRLTHPAALDCPFCNGTGEVISGDDDDGTVLHVAKDSYGVVQNDTGWDIVDAIVGEGAKYETGITMKDGAVCSVLAWLPEPTKVPGDDSEILPWVNVAWSHDGSSAITARATSIRTVCWNTQSASEAEGKRLGTDFTFRHTKNVGDRIADAKLALQGVRDGHEAYMELANELAAIPVSDEQRELFVTQFIPTPPEALISDRVRANIEQGRANVRALFDGESVPDAHRNTAYGLHLAGVEYLDHLRPARSPETKYGRSLLRNEPAKAKLTKLIRECAVA